MYSLSLWLHFNPLWEMSVQLVHKILQKGRSQATQENLLRRNPALLLENISFTDLTWTYSANAPRPWSGWTNPDETKVIAYIYQLAASLSATH